MAEYINRDAFLEQKRAWYCENCDMRKNSKGKTVYEIGEAPCRACDIGDVLDSLEDFLAADVVEVVRCGECKFLDYDGELFCEYFQRGIEGKDFFCAHGERRTNWLNT